MLCLLSRRRCVARDRLCDVRCALLQAPALLGDCYISSRVITSLGAALYYMREAGITDLLYVFYLSVMMDIN